MEKLNIRDFSRVVFFTGAGISAESGIPTYRGKGGMWEQYNYEDYACQEAFVRDPLAVWEFHNMRREAVAKCAPNAGHTLIAELEAEGGDVAVVTQNIDGLHPQAGSQKVFELHGSLWRVRCDACGVIEERREVPLAPLTHSCGGYWRPDIVWFGDALNEKVIEDALMEIAKCDLLVSIGTSAVVFPAAQFPVIAKQKGATLVEINPQETPLSGIYDLCLRGPTSTMLPTLLED